MLVGIEELVTLKIDRTNCIAISDIADTNSINKYFSNFLSKNILSNL
jgi:hypothetical protein